MSIQPKRVVTLKLTPDEARALEVLLDEQAAKLHHRHNLTPSFAAQQLADRYLVISEKVRKARNPAPPRERANA